MESVLNAVWDRKLTFEDVQSSEAHQFPSGACLLNKPPHTLSSNGDCDTGDDDSFFAGPIWDHFKMGSSASLLWPWRFHGTSFVDQLWSTNWSAHPLPTLWCGTWVETECEMCHFTIIRWNPFLSHRNDSEGLLASKSVFRMQSAPVQGSYLIKLRSSRARGFPIFCKHPSSAGLLESDPLAVSCCKISCAGLKAGNTCHIMPWHMPHRITK